MRNAARSWDTYNIAKERRFMARTAALQLVPRTCEDCAGRGVDPGSVDEPEPCPSCAGSGVLIPQERAERKGPGTASTAQPDTSTVEERRTNLK